MREHKNLMIVGTSSGAGKSITVAGLCRIFYRDGYKTVPFKSQNMALNSFITKEGYEMGRAQVVQAMACFIEPKSFMNPILLKPTGEKKSQIIVNGKSIGNMEWM
ncbi:MAG: cobyric acid synthase, partial [Fusobacteriaceae bacterium]